MLNKCLNTIYEYNMLSHGDKVVVGLSGGADSCALIHILYRLKDRLGISITAVHINHSLRGEESDGDERFARDFCAELNIPIICERHDITAIAEEKAIGTEEAGRLIRYDAFERALGKVENGKIAVAHNLNDRAETVLMRIARGTGIKGLTGISPVRGNIIRPLINCSRDEIEKYCAENGIKFHTDSTNNETVYTRNKVRLNIMPLFVRDINRNAVSNIAKTAESAALDNDFMEKETENAYNLCRINTFEKNIVYFDICKLKSLHEAIIKRVILKALAELSNAHKDIYSKNVDDVFYLINKGTGKSVSLPYGLKAETVYDRLKIYAEEKSEPESYSYDLALGDTVYVKETGKYVLVSDKNEKNNIKSTNLCTKAFDYDKIKGSLVVRNRLPGDFIRLYPRQGRKKLKDFFIDKKIPRAERDSMCFIACGSEAVWIPGYWALPRSKTEGKNGKVLYIHIWEDA